MQQLRLGTLTIVGVGLIGGAIGLAAKKRGLARHIRGVGRDAARLDTARRLGAIDEADVDLARAVADADCVVFCTPVNRIAEQVAVAARACPSQAILTDAGSTKQAIVDAIASDRFVGAHPLAGSEKKGVEHAHADLFVGRWTILTPTPRTSPDALDRVRAFWESLGARLRLMTPADHDRALALTSHLPQLLAAALAGLLPDELRDLAATGFRDTTRIAGGDVEVWTPIFQHNRLAVLDALSKLEQRLQQFRLALTMDDVAELDRWLTEGKKVRDALGN
jgi:prephenate dehydrogenase